MIAVYIACMVMGVLVIVITSMIWKVDPLLLLDLLPSHMDLYPINKMITL